MSFDPWRGCYDSGWQGKITPESFSHPAKFSRALIRRIYEHALSEGWLAPGMTVLDPFGGVALGALDAVWNGLNYVGVELEPKFVKLGQANIDLWQRKYGSKEGFGSARIIEGDSRKLAQVIQGADCCIGSPPFNKQMNSGGSGTTNFIRDQAIQTGRDPNSPSRKVLNQSKQWPESEGQIASLPEGRFEAIVGSPPYEGSLNSGQGGIDWDKAKRPERWTENRNRKGCQAAAGHQMSYGESENQLGATTGPTFWSAARDILIQCHTILKPGGHAIWVCKDFIRKGKRIPFSDQWQALCESIGFRLVCRHRAMLVKKHGEQETIFNGTEQIKTERKSFFRRLHEKKHPGTEIDWEDILCCEKS